MNLERPAKPQEVFESHVAGAPFNVPDVSSVQFRAVSEFFLGQIQLLSPPPNQKPEISNSVVIEVHCRSPQSLEHW
jgi:hypothetical protein